VYLSRSTRLLRTPVGLNLTWRRGHGSGSNRPPLDAGITTAVALPRRPEVKGYISTEIDRLKARTDRVGANPIPLTLEDLECVRPRSP
jgi:hypothetical protein